MLKSLVPVTAVIALVAGSAPAAATGVDEGNVIATAPGSNGPTTAQPREKRYCIVSEFTGSRLPLKVCKTRKQWEAEGVSIKTER